MGHLHHPFLAKSKRSDFEGFQSPEVMEEKGKIASFIYLVSLSSQKHKRMTNICTLFLVNIQSWLNLPRDDHHSFYIFPWMIATLATNRNSYKRP
jgi:hypothetical protein